MKIVGNLDMLHSLKFGLFNLGQVTERARVANSVGPHLEIIMEPSGETDVRVPGRKCEHGTYIPSNSFDPNRAEFCSSCYQVEIHTREEKSSAS